MKAIFATTLLVAGLSWGKCRPIAAGPVCMCGDVAAWVAEVQATSSELGTVTQVFAGGAGVVGDAGTPPMVGSLASFPPGDVMPGQFVLLDSAGGSIVVRDGGIACKGFTVAAEQWARAVGDDTCLNVLIDAGFKPPPPPACHDDGVFPGCGSGSRGAPLELALVAVLLWRRSRRGA